MFPYSLTESCRTLKQVEAAQPVKSASDYVMGVDLATSGSSNADNAVICVLKLVEMESGGYLKKLVYMRSYHGKRLDALAEEVRKTYVRFPHMTRIVFDHCGLGDAFPQFLSQPWIDTATGKEYPPWTLDDERTIIHCGGFANPADCQNQFAPMGQTANPLDLRLAGPCSGA